MSNKADVIPIRAQNLRSSAPLDQSSKADDAASGNQSVNRKSLTAALVLLCAVQFMLVLDGTIVSVALSSIGRDLQMSQQDLQWVVNAYTLAFGGFLLLGGRAADLLGRRRIFVAGLVLFTLASLLGGFAQTGLWLTVSRSLQGLGGALVSPAALSILTTMFAEGATRNRALGAWGATSACGAVCGVFLGGLLTTYLGWRWVLFVNVPIGVAAALLSYRWLSPCNNPNETDCAEIGNEKKGFDIAGALTITAALILFVYATIGTIDFGWLSWRTILTFAISIGLFGLFVWIEKLQVAPLVDFTIFRLPGLLGANLAAFVQAVGPMATLFFVSFYLQQVLGLSPLLTGLAFVPFAIVAAISSVFSDFLVRRSSVRAMAATGLLLMAIGLLLLSRITTAENGGSFFGDVFFASLLIGAGITTAQVPITIAAVAGVAEERSGLASGLLNTSQQIGGAIILAILVTFAGATTKTELAAGANEASALVAGYHLAFLIGAGLLIFGAIVAWFLIGAVKPADAKAAAAAA